MQRLDADFIRVYDDFKNVLITSNKLIKRFDVIEKIEIEKGEKENDLA